MEWDEMVNFDQILAFRTVDTIFADLICDQIRLRRTRTGRLPKHHLFAEVPLAEVA